MPKVASEGKPEEALSLISVEGILEATYCLLPSVFEAIVIKKMFSKPNILFMIF